MIDITKSDPSIMTKPLRVGYLSSSNYLDRNVFSGTLYYMYKALERLDIELVQLGKPKVLSSDWMERVKGKAVKEINKFFKHNKKEKSEDLNAFGDLVYRQLEENPCDIIFAPVCRNLISRLSLDIPVVSFSDATVCLLREGYNTYTEPEKYNIAYREEKAMMENSAMVVYSSEWAANSAMHDFGLNSSRIRIIHLGANLDNIPEKSKIFDKLSIPQCQLLFVGKDWERKGGAIAYQTLLDLLAMGLDVNLTMVGSRPPTGHLQHPNLKIIPFLNKNIPSQQNKLANLFLSSHFLLFPTRSDCSPIVICEANAHGVPVISTDVGGISSIIKPGKNGCLLPLSSQSHDFASAVVEIYREKDLYEKLVRDSRTEYEERLNWSTWATKMHSVFLEVANKSSFE
ncbi:MAG: glycosyltransferase family 4 protein [Synechocystis sp.]|nr:glycosyltransferase family 4 protein [Synechocystis sp.]